MSIEQIVDTAKPVPEWRPYDGAEGTQRDYTVALTRAMRNNDYVVLDAPTGAGKSVMLYTALMANGAAAYYTTPLNTLVDQLIDDDHLDELMALKGKNNYECIHDETEGEPVDEAKCHREPSWGCPIKEQCPYYRKRSQIDWHPLVATNVSMLMSQSTLPPEMRVFEPRPVLVIDECQKVEDFLVDFTTIDLSIFDDGSADVDSVSGAITVAEPLLEKVNDVIRELSSRDRLSRDEVQRLNWLKRYRKRLVFVLMRLDQNPSNWVVDDGEELTLLKPVEVAPIAHRLLWRWGGTVVFSSATVPDGLLRDLGISPGDVERVEVPSTFPVENRPVVMDGVGKMTEGERDETIPLMANRVAEIAAEHEGDNGIIHCRSYSIAERLYDECPLDDDRMVLQDRGDREASLDEWLDGDAQVFFSVSMDEGIDLRYDDCRFQVLAKALYKFMGDKRVRTKVFDEGRWDWYQRHAAVQIQQAYGRGVRARDDECTFYICDTSAVELIERNEHMFENWFLEAVEN